MFSLSLILLKFRYLLKKYIKPVIKKSTPKFIWLFLKKVLNRNVRTQQMRDGIQKVFSEEWQYARMISNKNEILSKNHPGVNLIGNFQAATGLGQAVRGSELALKAAGIPFEIVDYKGDVPAWQQIERSRISVDPYKFVYNTNIFHINPPQLPFLWDYFEKSRLIGRYNIGVWFWELPKFPQEWDYCFNVVDEVWGATNFICDAIKVISPVPVVRIPPVVQVNPNLSISRDRFHLPENKFLFLCAYDVLSSHIRKNPHAAIQAFKRAFPKSDNNSVLVIKISNSQENVEGVRFLKEELCDFPNCHFIEGILSRDEFIGLLNLANVFISLHHSEGFGLIAAESMALGKPVILTNWSGNIDYMTEKNSCGVDYQLVHVGSTDVGYQPDQLWADPDIDHAAYYMKKLYNDSDYYKLISINAREHIKTHYSPEVIGRLIWDRLNKCGLLKDR